MQLTNHTNYAQANAALVGDLLDFDGSRPVTRDNGQQLRPELKHFADNTAASNKTPHAIRRTRTAKPQHEDENHVGVFRKAVTTLLAALLMIVLVYTLNVVHPDVLDNARNFWSEQSHTATAGITRAYNASLRGIDGIRRPESAAVRRTSRPARSDSTVRGIIAGENGSAALVGRDVVHVGDSVGGATVTAISRQEVTFRSPFRTWTQPVGR